MNHLDECVVGFSGLMALWGLWYFFLKEQRVDMYREELFALRDELFDMALRGELRFGHRAYTEFRLLLNGMIRFAHRADLVGFTISLFRKRLRGERSEAFARWEIALKDLAPPTQAKLRILHERMIRLFWVHLFTGSITLLMIIGPMLLLNFCGAVWRRVSNANRLRLSFKRGLDRALVRLAKRTNARAFEADAYCSELEAESRREELQTVS